MLTSIAPSGMSAVARECVGQALDLVRHRHALQAADAFGLPEAEADRQLLSVGRKALSLRTESLRDDAEVLGLIKLLVLAEDISRQAMRSGSDRDGVRNRPDIELADMRRRAGYLVRHVPKATSLRAAIPRRDVGREAS